MTDERLERLARSLSELASGCDSAAEDLAVTADPLGAAFNRGRASAYDYCARRLREEASAPEEWQGFPVRRDERMSEDAIGATSAPEPEEQRCSTCGSDDPSVYREPCDRALYSDHESGEFHRAREEKAQRAFDEDRRQTEATREAILSRCSPEPSEEGWRQANETLDKLHAAERKLAEVERERDNLRFERNACEHNRRRDNEHLIGERDEARAEVEQLRAISDSDAWNWMRDLRAEAARGNRLREALAELIEEVRAMDLQLEQEFGVSTDPDYGKEHEAIKRARAVLGETEEK